MNTGRQGAEYLLRFDDLCPTMNHARWERMQPILQHYRIRPILAVVPDNQDPELCIDSPNPAFWEEMRHHAANGASIALHGYQHLCSAMGLSLVPLNRQSEFAGVPEHEQRVWIHRGLEILYSHGLQSRLWVAPRHGLDRNTLRALLASGIRIISDGLARVPYTEYGHLWIPQQLWRPVEQSEGLWTICVHTNTMTDAQFAELHSFIARHAASFTSVERVVKEWPIGPRSLHDRSFATSHLLRRRVTHMLARVLGHRRAQGLAESSAM